MNAFNDTLLSVVDRLSRQLGPLTALIDAVADRIAPQLTAQAQCPPSGYQVCYVFCGNCCANCSGDYRQFIVYGYAVVGYCNTGPWYQCVSNCDYC